MGVLALALLAACDAPVAQQNRSASAATTSADRSGTFAPLIEAYAAPWNTTTGKVDFERLGAFYAPGSNVVIWDISPIEPRLGWADQQRTLQRTLFADMVSNSYVPRSDLGVTPLGDRLAVTYFTFDLGTVSRGGKRTAVVGRQSHVWEQQGDQWRIIHEHGSGTVRLGATLPSFSAPGAEVPASERDPEVAERVGAFWAAWNQRDAGAMGRFYEQSDDLIVVLPWREERFVGWPAFQTAAGKVLSSLERVRFTPDLTQLRVLRRGDVAIATGPFQVDLRGRDGTTTRGGARYTLVWRRGEDGWRVAHEHLSSSPEPQS